MKKAPAQIKFSTNKRGQLCAYRFCKYSMRFFRMSLADAKHFIATGQSREIYKDVTA